MKYNDDVFYYNKTNDKVFVSSIINDEEHIKALWKGEEYIWPISYIGVKITAKPEEGNFGQFNGCRPGKLKDYYRERS